MKVGRTYIIAEAGVNHNGRLDLAKELVLKAVEAKADAVKFQSFIPEELLTAETKQCDYQLKNTGKKETQLEMIKKLVLSQEEQLELFNFARAKNIHIMSTAFDFPSLDLLVKFGMERFKIPSGEITNAPLLLEIARQKKPIILSTGMSTLNEIEDALGVLAFGLFDLQQFELDPNRKISRECFKESYYNHQAKLSEYITVLHCSSEYPANLNNINLKAMQLLRDSFSLPIGYSDHSEGISIPIAAVALGACVIEKHFTLDKTMEGPDHRASLEPVELKQMVTGIREVEQALGEKVKKPSPLERENSKLVRKSLVAAKELIRGDRFNSSNIKIKRPGIGMNPYPILGTTR